MHTESSACHDSDRDDDGQSGEVRDVGTMKDTTGDVMLWMI